jgi:hypothetical protein
MATIRALAEIALHVARESEMHVEVSTRPLAPCR